jgi:hypothetical protein
MNFAIDSVFGTMGEYLPEEFAGYLGFPVILVAVLICGLMAIYSYRIFRLSLTVFGAIGLGVVGGNIVAPLLINAMGEAPEGISMVAVCGFISALIGGLLMNFLFKVALFLSGAGAGFGLGISVVLPLLINQFPDSTFFAGEGGFWVVGGVCALILGILFIFLFKFLYIVSTSMGGMITASLLVCTAIVPDGGVIVVAASIIIGFVAGIFAAVKQYKACEEY